MHKDGGRSILVLYVISIHELEPGLFVISYIYIMGNVSEEFYKIKLKKNTGISCKSTLVHHSSFSSSWTDDD